MKNHVRRGFAMLAITAAIVGLAATPAHADESVQVQEVSAQAEGDKPPAVLNNVNSGKAMVVKGASKANNALAIQYDYTSALPNNDVMFLEHQGGNWYRIKPWHAYTNDGNVHNDKCLVVKSASNANSADVIQYTCTYDDTQNDVWLWERLLVITSSGISFRTNQFRNLKSGKCLNVKSRSMANGAQLIQYTCNDSSDDPYNSYWSAPA